MGYRLGGRENRLALPKLPDSDPKEELLAVGSGIACSWQIWVSPEDQLCIPVVFHGHWDEMPATSQYWSRLLVGIQSRS